MRRLSITRADYSAWPHVVPQQHAGQVKGAGVLGFFNPSRRLNQPPWFFCSRGVPACCRCPS